MRGVLEVELIFVLPGQSLQHAVKYVIISLVWTLVDNPGLLQQVLIDLGPLDNPVLVEVDVDVLSKS